MKVAIINTASKGTEVHGHNCADVKKSATRNGDDAWIVEVDSKLDVSHTYWADQISDTCEVDSAEGWSTAEAWLGEFNFLPCTKGLEDGVNPFATEDEAPAVEAPATAVSTWVGRAMAEEIRSAHAETPLAAKIDAAKVTKAGDRTIKFTAEEATTVRELCTELEGKGGSLAYSARTLRARLA
jgi:hypothetical protein